MFLKQAIEYKFRCKNNHETISYMKNVHAKSLVLRITNAVEAECAED